MPRKYVRKIRFYDSWFDDLNDESKEFTSAEKWAVIMAIVESQRAEDVAPMDDLPREIRRALQMPTIKEQLTSIIEKASNNRAKGSMGGRTTANGGRNEDAERARSASEDAVTRHKNALPPGYSNLDWVKYVKQRENEGDKWAIYLRSGKPDRCDLAASEYREELINKTRNGDLITRYLCKYCNIDF